ncbi:hypothetical protein CAOG_09095 [Capsaspora owczarzaki ATCC 30864]|uniref:Sulfite oxidase n=1 Tax=Capsaspora owczarzaki (strain ATCC 30864) TaxID=595528 RepID=A0A0D2WVS0_CAPO3|nr:hypothetical protein CAOG_09095 [Capsaspora owczarzaki ATCC 30864]KJE96975.1 hypothetical protein CAOG_009095 [Capsaspora owczarzaki ATCC 30864]|eukprot:XP_011270752.1 hypothetical protein CAOG_09095 [Capsaspora owczarzaki ATCC 30864]
MTDRGMRAVGSVCNAMDSAQQPAGTSTALIVRNETPFNAETPAMLLPRAVLTPSSQFFIRSHGEVPNVNVQQYRLKVGGLVKNELLVSLADLYRLPCETVSATVVCAGNRRNEMSRISPIKGVGWDSGAIGNAVWSGVKLYRLLELAGVQQNVRHVLFEGLDHIHEQQASTYQVSIPLSKAADPNGDVLLAYEMNGEPLAPAHGFPLRVIVPGFVGARSVKWIQSITLSDCESDGMFQQHDYKLTPGFIDAETFKRVWREYPAIQEMPVQSAICFPPNGYKHASGTPLTVRGYAHSGGGKRITRVDLSVDGGNSWSHSAILTRGTSSDAPYAHDWSWTLWEVAVPSLSTPCQLACRAWDAAGNSQPATVDSIWNFRGLLNNAQHRVRVLPSASL